MSDSPNHYRLRPTADASRALVLDPAQQRVVDTVAQPGHGPLLVLAGPGTGKTTTIVESVAARVAAGTPVGEVLALTFSRKAAQELRTRISAALPQAVAEPVAWTFHAFSYRLIGEAWASEPAASGWSDRPRLLSGPEQDVVLRELLAGAEDVPWPTDLAAALQTRGFADELQSLLSRARCVGLDSDRLREVATGRADWAAAADFLAEYLDVLALSGSVDYAELVGQAVGWAQSERGREALHNRYSLVVVDEYQDTDPQQEQLLSALAGGGRDVMVVGDPDQSIYAFRGADVSGIVEFPDRFRSAGAPPSAARVLTLAVSRRSGSALLEASRRIAERLPGELLPSTAVKQHRALQPAASVPPGSVEVYEHASAGSELRHVSDVLRREHLENGTAWGSMAVLVRSGTTAIPAIRRALTLSGVPVEVAGDELPLALDPSVAPLLLALRVAVEPSSLTSDVAQRLLLSPLAGADPAGLRRLGRVLRQAARESLVDQGEAPLPPAADVLIRDAVADRRELTLVSDDLSAPVERLATVLAQARELAGSGASAYDVLWLLWSATPWRRSLERAALGGGATSRTANRDLDAVVALFEAASRTETRVKHRGVLAFLDELQAQQIPGDTLAERGVRPDAVRLLTAHRAKGLEWDVVVLPSVQEGSWPDLRRRGSLLEADRLTVDGPTDPATAAVLLAEERRLFYVAVTRARRRLVVSSVSANDADGTRPSRFVSELGVPPVPVQALPQRSLTMAALVGELRAVTVNQSAPADLRAAAAQRLGQLVVDGVHAADPDRWWGVRDQTQAGPVRDQTTALRLSGSSLEGLVRCPLRWFLEHEAAAEESRSVAMGFGSVVHALADEIAQGDTPPDLEVLDQRLDLVWHELGFDARWQSTRERDEARAALMRLLHWLAAERGRRFVASEQRFDLQLTIDGRDGPRPVALRGFIDRLELDDDGRVHVVDYKTGRSKPTNTAVGEHVQLGVYQYAVTHGAFDHLGVPAVAGGAELVQLRHDAARKAGGPYVQPQEPLGVDDDGRTFVDTLLQDAVESIDAELFAPKPGDVCSTCPFTIVCPTQSAGRQVVS
ncbi:MAG: ATP-dependent DNA helicase [Actinomycetes bacterium]